MYGVSEREPQRLPIHSPIIVSNRYRWGLHPNLRASHPVGWGEHTRTPTLFNSCIHRRIEPLSLGFAPQPTGYHRIEPLSLGFAPQPTGCVRRTRLRALHPPYAV
jgi:hypothetical protein